jgi:hypothetical protein
MTPRWWLAHIVLLALVFAAHQAGLVVQTWRADQTYLTAIIAVVWGLGILASAFNHWDAVEWLAQRCFQLGLIGTVLGFIIALSGVDPEQAQNLAATKAMVATLIIGMSTALYTTLLGAPANLWLRFLGFALQRN